MPKCIVPGCTSGYKSNPEKVHFFTIPKNVESEKLWKSAVKRKDDVVKAGAPVCEKHFRTDEILWQREYLDPNGQVIGVGKYKVPRLKKGCIPTIFSWVEETDELQCTNFSTQGKILSEDQANPANPEDQESTDGQTVVAADQANLNHSENATEKNIYSAAHIHSSSEIVSCTAEPILSPCENEILQTENKETPATGKISRRTSTLDFSEIQKSNLYLPLGWIKYESGCAGKRLLFFFVNETMEIEDSFQMFPSKNIMIKEDMSMNIRIFGLLLSLKDFDISGSITSLEELENLLSMVHRFNKCLGVIHQSMTSGNSEIDLSRRLLLQDNTGTWRHKSCPLLLRNAKLCARCSTVKNTLRKNRRKFRQNETKMQRKKILGLQEQRKQFLNLQAKYRSVLKAKRLARQKMKTLQSEVSSIRRKIANCSSHDLEQLTQNGNIPQNQLHALNQIIHAAKHKGSKGRNYSEQWIPKTLPISKRI